MRDYYTDGKGHFTCKRPSHRKLAKFKNGVQIGEGWFYVGRFWSAVHAKRNYKPKQL